MTQDLFSEKSTVTKNSKQTIHGQNRIIYVNRIVLEMNQRTDEFMFNVDFKLSYLKDASGEFYNAPFQGFHVISRYNTGAQRPNYYQIITYSQFKHLCDVCGVTVPSKALLDRKWDLAQDNRQQAVLYDYQSKKASFVFEGTIVQDPQALNSSLVRPELAGWVNMSTIAPLGTKCHPKNTYNADLEMEAIQEQLNSIKENKEKKSIKKDKSYQTQTSQSKSNSFDYDR